MIFWIAVLCLFFYEIDKATQHTPKMSEQIEYIPLEEYIEQNEPPENKVMVLPPTLIAPAGCNARRIVDVNGVTPDRVFCYNKWIEIRQREFNVFCEDEDTMVQAYKHPSLIMQIFDQYGNPIQCRSA